MNRNLVPPGAKFLAHGGAAEVWLVDAPNLADRKCVLKIIRLSLETLKENYGSKGAREATQLWENFTSTFRSKVNQWKPLVHINVVQILDLNERLDLSVEYCAQGTASEYLATHRHESVPLRRIMIGDVLAGLNYLHSQSPPVAHGCIRMDKLFIDTRGTTKLGEFGITSLLEDFEFFEPSVSLASQVRWMSPELLLASTDQAPAPTEASDIWALGCTLFEITSGKLPYFRYKHDLRVRREIISENFPGGQDDLIDPDLAEFWILLAPCLKGPPEQRPSVKELLRTTRWRASVDDGPRPPLPTPSLLCNPNSIECVLDCDNYPKDVQIWVDERVKQNETWGIVFDSLAVLPISWVTSPGDHDIALLPFNGDVELRGMRLNPETHLNPRAFEVSHILKTSIGTKRLVETLTAVVYFHFHLKAQNPEAPVRALIDMKLQALSIKPISWARIVYEPKGDDLFGDSLSVGSVAVLRTDPDQAFGLELINHSQESLFPYVLYYNFEDYSVSCLYNPGHMVKPPFQAGETLTIGYGSSESLPFQIDLTNPESEKEYGAFMLLVSSEWVDFTHLQQKSPFGSNPYKARGQRQNVHQAGIWDSIVVQIEMVR